VFHTSKLVRYFDLLCNRHDDVIITETNTSLFRLFPTSYNCSQATVNIIQMVKKPSLNNIYVMAGDAWSPLATLKYNEQKWG